MAKLKTFGKGLYYGSIGQPQCRFGDEKFGLSAEFSTENWNDNSSIRVDYKYLAEFRGDKVDENGWYLLVYAIKKDKGKQLEELLLTRIFVKSESIHCPHCSSELGRVNDRWKCGNTNCHVDYSNDSCTLLAKIDSSFTEMSKMTKTLVIKKKDEKL